MSLTPFAALISVLVGMMCGAGEGYPHGAGFAVAGGILGTGIGIAGAWLFFRFERIRVPERWGRVPGYAGSVAWASAILWLPLLVGVASVFSAAGLVRAFG